MTAQKEPRWIARAKGELGQHRIPGPGNNPRIMEYFNAAGVTPPDGDNTSWCAAFESWCLLNEPDAPKTAWARDFLKYGEKIDEPEYGCICVWDRGNGYGHVNFYLGQAGDGRILCIGGNQGGGTHPSEVTISTRSLDNLLGFRRVPTADEEEVDAVEQAKVDRAEDDEEDAKATPREIVAGLREAGSRTITNADATEDHTDKVVKLTGMEVVIDTIHQFAPVSDMVKPFIKGFEVILVAFILFFAGRAILAQQAIKTARADDHATGANTGRTITHV